MPSTWYEQLAVGGRLVAPVVSDGRQQVLVIVDRTNSGFQQTVLEQVNFVPLKSGLG